MSGLSRVQLVAAICAKLLQFAQSKDARLAAFNSDAGQPPPYLYKGQAIGKDSLALVHIYLLLQGPTNGPLLVRRLH